MIHLPGLEIFDAAQHVQMTSRVLLDHIHDVIWAQALFELPLGYQELHNAERGKKITFMPQKRCGKQQHSHNMST